MVPKDGGLGSLVEGNSDVVSYCERSILKFKLFTVFYFIMNIELNPKVTCNIVSTNCKNVPEWPVLKAYETGFQLSCFHYQFIWGWFSQLLDTLVQKMSNSVSHPVYFYSVSSCFDHTLIVQVSFWAKTFPSSTLSVMKICDRKLSLMTSPWALRKCDWHFHYYLADQTVNW